MTTVKFRALVPVVLTLVLAACTSTQTVAPTTTKGTGVVTGTANLSSLERQELAAANKAWAGVGRFQPSQSGSSNSPVERRWLRKWRRETRLRFRSRHAALPVPLVSGTRRDAGSSSPRGRRSIF